VLVVVQLPFADLRPVLTLPTYRLDRPHWSNPLHLIDDVGRGFVRGMGHLRNRRGHGDLSWENEGIYCAAANAIRFPRHFEDQPFGSITGFRGSSALGSRRFYAYGPIVRFEVSMSRPLARHGLSGRELDDFLASVLQVPVRIGGGGTLVPLHTALDALGELVLRSTTRTVQKPEPQCRLLPGRPSIIVEYREGEIDPGPAGHQLLPVEYFVNLDYRDVKADHCLAQAWLLGADANSDKDALRRIRIHLTRLHSELECARLVLSALGNFKVSQVNLHQVGDYVRRFLNLLEKKTAYGHEQEPILQQALAAHLTNNPNDWPVVEQAAEGTLAWLKRHASVYPL
jgi:hypothetical protein